MDAAESVICILLAELHDYRVVGLTYRYAFPTVQLFREIREELIWADGGQVKKATDAAILSLLGPKTEADLQAGKKKPTKKVSRYNFQA